MDDDFAERLSNMTDVEILTQLPKQASLFFAEHPALLHAWRMGFTSAAKAQEMTHNYFMRLAPDVQYGIVFQISEVHRQAQALHTYFNLQGELKASTLLEDVARFQRYGVNLHFSFDQYHKFIRSISDQIHLHRNVIHTTMDQKLIKNSIDEINELKKLFDDVNNQMAKFYPELLKTISGG